ncbi:MAG: 4Fe-4S binding protein [Candidatus Methanomethylophilaceae archaeon]|nr:4Fe-4S binding protein [Candidatus Methanomethylophilaceae archaeon]
MKLIPRLAKRTMKFFFHSRYRLARWTRKSRFFGDFVEKVAFENDDIIVIPKDGVVRSRNIEMNIDIPDAGDRTVLPSDAVKSVLRKMDGIFIMNFCICRRSNPCEDYPVDHGCIFLGEGIRNIPPEFGHVATPEEADAYLDECADLGLVHIMGRNKLDRLWLSTGRKNRLMTICNCCPCCCLWNMTRDISEGIGGAFKRMDGVEISADTEKCIGCGMCQDICFTKAVKIVDGKCTIDDSQCRGCGRCAERCPKDAITITYDESKVESEAERIASLFA